VIFLRKLHKWLGLIIGAQLVIWLLSGTLISFIDQQVVSGAMTRQVEAESVLLKASGPFLPVSELAPAATSAHTVTLDSFLGYPVYKVEAGGETTLFDANSGSLLRIDRQLAEQVVNESYVGAGRLISIEHLEFGSNEVRGFPGPVWRADFNDDLATRVYVSASDGKVLAHRNSQWQIVDFLLMLHFMDYVRADSFNNPQIIAIGFGTLWIAISGLLLVFYSFSRSDFLWLPGVTSGGHKVRGTVKSAGHGEQQLGLAGSLSYYAGLSQRGINLPSNCDGSGSCGLCRVRYEKNIPEQTPVDREWLDSEALQQGMRLACQHKPQPGDVIIVPDMAFQQTSQRAEVVSSRWLTPLLKEIRLRPDVPVEFSPGNYLEFQVPPFQADLARMAVPDAFMPIWDALSLPGCWSHADTVPVCRTYSIATAANQTQPQELVFTVRFAPPPTGSQWLPGAGSSYMCGLQDGDPVEFRGPAGDFGLVDSDKEKILIGGGAGMAPLKSMVLHLLENQSWQGKLRFWYGARNQQEIPYRERFDALSEKHANFEWQVALSDATDDRTWSEHLGLIHEVVFDQVLKIHPSLHDCEFYLCGPPPMLVATRKLLRDLGVSDGNVRFDDFGN